MTPLVSLLIYFVVLSSWICLFLLLTEDTPDKNPKNPPSSTPAKRSNSMSSVSLVRPISSPSMMSSQKEPPSITRDPKYPGTNSFTRDGLASLTYYETNEDVFWTASPIMFALTGPRVAAQILAPSFTAMKERYTANNLNV